MARGMHVAGEGVMHQHRVRRRRVELAVRLVSQPSTAEGHATLEGEATVRAQLEELTIGDRSVVEPASRDGRHARCH